MRVGAFIRAKRLTLAHGDPMLRFIPPQRDLVLILNCDMFQVSERGGGRDKGRETDRQTQTERNREKER